VTAAEGRDSKEGARLPRADLWVFAYGSLIWRPGFDFAEARGAELAGFRRDMCFTSIRYRGTPEKPGMVCGLMAAPGATCKGRAYRVEGDKAAAVTALIDARELVNNIYAPEEHEIALDDRRRVRARVYVGVTDHAQFAGAWSEDEKAQAIAQAVGSEGPSIDYLVNLVAHLEEMGIDDAHLARLLERARRV
jgi:cation transport protein ChaC